MIRLTHGVQVCPRRLDRIAWLGIMIHMAKCNNTDGFIVFASSGKLTPMDYLGSSPLELLRKRRLTNPTDASAMPTTESPETSTVSHSSEETSKAHSSGSGGSSSGLSLAWPPQYRSREPSAEDQSAPRAVAGEVSLVTSSRGASEALQESESDSLNSSRDQVWSC